MCVREDTCSSRAAASLARRLPPSYLPPDWVPSQGKAGKKALHTHVVRKLPLPLSHFGSQKVDLLRCFSLQKFLFTSLCCSVSIQKPRPTHPLPLFFLSCSPLLLHSLSSSSPPQKSCQDLHPAIFPSPSSADLECFSRSPDQEHAALAPRLESAWKTC